MGKELRSIGSSHASAVKLESVSIDWATCVYTDDHSRRIAQYRASRWMLDREKVGNYRRGWNLASLMGTICGGVAYGESCNLSAIQLSGPAADTFFEQVATTLGRFSRLDVQGTCISEQWGFDPVKRAYRGSAGEKQVGRQVQARLYICGTDGGSTAYAGSKTSEWRVRVYDKGVESQTAPPGMKYRWEIQLRRKHAQHAAETIRLAPTRQEGIQKVLTQYAAKANVWLPRALTGIREEVSLQRDPSDLAATLDWLRRGVRPSVERAVKFVGVDEVARLLGLVDAAGTSPGEDQEAQEATDGDG